MLARGMLGSGWTGRVSSWPFRNFSSWWWLISSVFLIRISCHKTTHANGYYGAWPGWAVSVSVLPLTLGRKVMTTLDSILKSRDITLPTNVHLVKTMVYPVVMYRCQSWIIKKGECWKIDAFELWCWRRPLRVPWTASVRGSALIETAHPGQAP